jgi:signal transduction histidine kinase
VRRLEELLSGAIAVYGDETALRRLLLILVDNAIKYTPAGGMISIRLAPEESAALIRITDTGIGIAPADLPYVFDRFWRADKVRSRATGGTGLGLAIARWIVNRHGGVIVVSSEVWRESAFTVTLPLAPRPNLLPEGVSSSDLECVASLARRRSRLDRGVEPSTRTRRVCKLGDERPCSR